MVQILPDVGVGNQDDAAITQPAYLPRGWRQPTLATDPVHKLWPKDTNITQALDLQRTGIIGCRIRRIATSHEASIERVPDRSGDLNELHEQVVSMLARLTKREEAIICSQHNPSLGGREGDPHVEQIVRLRDQARVTVERITLPSAEGVCITVGQSRDPRRCLRLRLWLTR